MLSYLYSSNRFLASAGDGESRTIFADGLSCGCAAGLVYASSIAGVRLWNINWSVGVVGWPLLHVLEWPHRQHVLA
ncbi:hypothetical protein Tco_0742667 [Tanacetum coccineum]